MVFLKKKKLTKNSAILINLCKSFGMRKYGKIEIKINNKKNISAIVDTGYYTNFAVGRKTKN